MRPPSFCVNSHQLMQKSEYWVASFQPLWQEGHEIDRTTYPKANFSLFFAADRPDGLNEETDPLALLAHYLNIRNVFACMFDSYYVGLDDGESHLSDLADRLLMYF